jgi:hypothetical protein
VLDRLDALPVGASRKESDAEMFRYARINRKKGMSCQVSSYRKKACRVKAMYKEVGKWLKIEYREESKSGIINAVPESGQR